MKNQIRKLKTKLTSRGSILVYTLIVMMIMLATALSIFAVAVREKKSAGTTAASAQAFAVADSGSEIALQQVDRNPNNTVGSLGTICTGSTVTIDVAGGKADLTFYSDENAADPIACDGSNGTLGNARKVKSVGQYAGTARAVEVAVALSGVWDDCVFATGSVGSNISDGSGGGVSFGTFAECPSGYKIVLGGCDYGGVNGWGGGPWKFISSGEGWGCATSGSVRAYAKCCR